MYLIMVIVVLKCSLLWETLTGKEHLFFYGRLKNLKGAALVKVRPIWIYIHPFNIIFTFLY